MQLHQVTRVPKTEKKKRIGRGRERESYMSRGMKAKITTTHRTYILVVCVLITRMLKQHKRSFKAM